MRQRHTGRVVAETRVKAGGHGGPRIESQKLARGEDGFCSESQRKHGGPTP